jgi:asparagine synthase (glutamine-hydrolysing)
MVLKEGCIQREAMDVVSSSQAEDVRGSRRKVIVFNGEIYNYRELRAEMEAQGETFQHDSDTEVLLRLIAREGAEALPKLAGMYSFAYWDEETGTALLARDPLGIKPLYYRLDDGVLSFASELRVLERAGDDLDPETLRDFFLWGSVPEPGTFVKPVRLLQTGHFIDWRRGEEVFPRRMLPEVLDRQTVTSAVDPNRTNESHAAASISPGTVRDALEESVARHLVSDVPVGIFLSGGIDSTVLLALVRKQLGPEVDIRTFSIGFADPAYDESGAAGRTARHFGANHTEWKITADEARAEIPRYLSAIDQPSIDGFNTWCVSKLARREGMKVVLSGLGADEVFGGYPSFRRVPALHSLHRIPRFLRVALSLLLQRFPVGSPKRRLADFLSGDGSWLEAYHAQRGIFTEEEATCLAEHLSGSVPNPVNWRIFPMFSEDRDMVSFLESTRYMRNQLLRDSDVFSMAHGLELRVPFVDERFLSTVYRIPASLRLAHRKRLLTDAVPEIPEWILSRPKRGFTFPFQQWAEEKLGDRLAAVENESPVPLITWYRKWAVAVAQECVERADGERLKAVRWGTKPEGAGAEDYDGIVARKGATASREGSGIKGFWTDSGWG